MLHKEVSGKWDVLGEIGSGGRPRSINGSLICIDHKIKKRMKFHPLPKCCHGHGTAMQGLRHNKQDPVIHIVNIVAAIIPMIAVAPFSCPGNRRSAGGGPGG